MRFVTLFLKSQNVHLVKDIGMIPWLLRKNHGVDSELVTWKNGDYPYLDTEVRGMKLRFIKKTPFGRIFDGCRYLRYESPSIDVLNIYHLNLASYFYEKIYLKYNPAGRVYLKLDMNNKGFADCFKQNPKAWIKRATIRRAKLVSVENKQMQEELNRRFPGKLFYLPNGFFEPEEKESACNSPEENTDYPENSDKRDNCPVRSSQTCELRTNKAAEPKKDLILTVGNLGTWEKATDILLAAFALFAENAEHDQQNPEAAKEYSLRLVGPIEPRFQKEIEEFFEIFPELKDRVTFTGPIKDRNELACEYEQARFFVLPSRSESFGFVLLEAGLSGCYLIASDGCSAARDITDNEKYGKIVKADDASSLAKAFSELCQPGSIPDFKGDELARHIRKNYSWDSIIETLYKRISAN